MSIFEHVFVFISVILGLAVVHLLGGLSLILDRRVPTRVYMILFAIGMSYNNKRFDAFTAIIFFAGLLGFLQSLVMTGLVEA